MLTRNDGRAPEVGRPVTIETDFVRTADGSCLICTGNTKVICTASVEENVPPFLRGKGQGWVTAEYAMLPASTGHRKQRDGVKRDGRGVEISRLIGRSLRQAVDLTALGERTITLDCDVLQADGGTRTAAITGAMVALVCAVSKLLDEGKLLRSPITHQIAAISVGVVDDTPCVDLCYEEDSRAQVDMNIVMNEKGEFVELQGTGEGRSFTQAELNALLDMGAKGIRALMEKQKDSLAESKRHLSAKPTLVVASSNQHKIRELQHISAITTPLCRWWRQVSMRRLRKRRRRSRAMRPLRRRRSARRRDCRRLRMTAVCPSRCWTATPACTVRATP